jgi:ribonuclease-3
MERPQGATGSGEPIPAALAAALGHDFQRPELLRQALTHPSAVSVRRTAAAHYERLEFLGDRVLALIIADLIMARFPSESEGALAKRLSALVRRETLIEVAAQIELDRHIVLGPGEQNGEVNASMMADCCEAVIGALYLDGGLEVARGFVVPLWTPFVEAETTPPQDAKTGLQEWAQGRGLALPEYREVAREGPHHEPRFTVEVRVEGQPPASGEGGSKRIAEQAAARLLLARLTGGGGEA